VLEQFAQNLQLFRGEINVLHVSFSMNTTFSSLRGFANPFYRTALLFFALLATNSS
jgi:hypothetical protein